MHFKGCINRTRECNSAIPSSKLHNASHLLDLKIDCIERNKLYTDDDLLELKKIEKNVSDIRKTLEHLLYCYTKTQNSINTLIDHIITGGD